MRCGEGIELFGSSVMWAVWTEGEYFITQVGKIILEKKIMGKKIWEKILKKKFWENNFEKKISGKNFGKKIWKINFVKKIVKKSFDNKNFGKINYKT